MTYWLIDVSSSSQESLLNKTEDYNRLINILLEVIYGGWSDGSVVRDFVALGEPGFDSQHPYCGSVTPDAGDPAPSSGLHGNCMHILGKYICRQNYSDTEK